MKTSLAKDHDRWILRLDASCISTESMAGNPAPDGYRFITLSLEGSTGCLEFIYPIPLSRQFQKGREYTISIIEKQFE